MILSRDWLWDRKISPKKAKNILNNPGNPHFLSLTSLLLSRKNTPKEVLKYYLKPVIFLQHWNNIKRQMRKDAWNNPRIEFWQVIYEKLKEKYKYQGIYPVKEIPLIKPKNEFCNSVAQRIKAVRKEKGMTQRELAKRLKISQQMISRIEKGGENISLITLKNIVDRLGAQLYLEIK